MVSTPPPSDDAEGHPPEESPHDEEHDGEEAKSASPSKKPAKQPKTSNRGHKLRHKQPTHYRTHTNDVPSGDPVMRQAMRYGVDPNTYPFPPPGAYPANTNPSYYPSPNLPLPAGYPSSYTYPGGEGYFSVPRASVRDPQYFTPSGYDVPPSGYSDPGYGPADSSGYNEKIPPYPEYPTREPKGSSVRPKPLRQPKPQTEPNLSSLRRDVAYPRPRQRRPSVPTRDRASSEEGITLKNIMAELRNLQRQVYQAEIQSDPGRIQGRPRRSPSVTSQYTSDDTRSLNIERERSRQLTSIIYRLLEDRQRPEYQDSLGLSSRQTMMDLLQGRVREHDGDMGLVSQQDTQEIRSKLDTILEYLQLEGGLEDAPAPQRLREGYESRPQPLVLRGQPSIASGSSVQAPPSPTTSRTTPRRRQTLPSVIRPSQDAQPSNQGRTRQLPTRLPEPDDDEDYEDFRLAPRPPRTRVSSSQSVASQDRRRLQTAVVQRSDARPPERKIVEGDQQKVRPGRFAYVQTEDEQDEEPARAPVPPYPVPDPPGQSKRRRSLQSVRFR
ncbi:uncharacterized protein FFUJ_10327 [Fusarium fujikuroi IMI 58289]|uniref:Uncharacterized protein n=1 Tax=Gibberella fujikuroi (strain CBS 195.34 / IMI 58289 / NRRL A-6831) TaxID=1279085 RepID=S0EGX5_GIBF5|nr:uncharacterized protein FFUJ_10327 [Fusarium fujikuroi IMI 58289]KLP01969.1 uncharacterized protein Y057_7814 [Fusarium fujikuroi]CCT74281.1 uncharacterized protein FFUJ_10327 [Fusarium fujikuroi IMI 58289]SCO09235.1 uncharacterized protein FFC1_11054 [Fusarium fujikuroi]SCO26333.1 uncharacterized protein FFM5_14602 [Fusarium fujikuroi]